MTPERRVQMISVLRKLAEETYADGPFKRDALFVIEELSKATCGKVQVRECAAPHGHEGLCRFVTILEQK